MGKGVPLPFTLVGTLGFTTCHCWHWYLEEPHLGRGHENIKASSNYTHPSIHYIWLREGWYMHIIQPCHLSYNIKTLKYEVMCDVSLLQVCDIILGKLYKWERNEREYIYSHKNIYGVRIMI